mgnify:CR=1 FL=1
MNNCIVIQIENLIIFIDFAHFSLFFFFLLKTTETGNFLSKKGKKKEKKLTAFLTLKQKLLVKQKLLLSKLSIEKIKKKKEK